MGLGRSPQWGPEVKPLVRRSWGQAPEAEEEEECALGPGPLRGSSSPFLGL